MTFLTFLSLIFSILVVSTSTVFSVLWLVGTFIVISFILALANLAFPALIYVVVYVGAIAILFLFVIQLIDTEEIKVKSIIDTKSRSVGPLALVFSLGLAGILAISAFIPFVYTVNASMSYIPTEVLNDAKQENSLRLSSLTETINFTGTLIDKPGVSPQVESFAEWLYGPGLFPLIIVSLILLVAMVAPIYLCKEDS